MVQEGSTLTIFPQDACCCFLLYLLPTISITRASFNFAHYPFRSFNAQFPISKQRVIELNVRYRLKKYAHCKRIRVGVIAINSE